MIDITELTDADYEAIADYVKKGYTEGRLDDDESGKRIYWKLQTTVWVEE